MDKIVVRDLQLPARIGVSTEERAAPQDVLVTAEMVADLSLAGASDNLADTVDYHSAVRTISELVRSSNSQLLEHLAEEIAARLLSLSLVVRVTVEVRKKVPPVEENVGTIGVHIERP
jgi:7,8-dihydroneopterin aldolase/epimerase/oxygenase